MRATQLKRSFYYRYVLRKQYKPYTEVETNVMVGIYIMNGTGERCSCNTLFAYLSKVHRTPYKQTLLSTLRKFKQDGMIRINGKGAATKMYLTLDGTMHLIELERKLRR